MKNKILYIFIIFMSFITITKANDVIEYKWSFDNTNHKEGLGLTSVIEVDNNYYTWHIDDNGRNKIIKYDENGNVLKTYSPDIKNPIIDITKSESYYYVIDSRGIFYKLNEEFKVEKKTISISYIPEDGSYSRIRINGEKIYFIDKSNYRLYYTDKNLTLTKVVDLSNFDEATTIISKVTFLTEEDQIYFRYLDYLYDRLDNDDDTYYEITDIEIKDDYFYITGYESNEEGTKPILKKLSKNLEEKWSFTENIEGINLSSINFNDYLFVLGIKIDEDYNTKYSIKIFNKEQKLIEEQELENKYYGEIPISLLEDSTGLVVKYIYENLVPQTIDYYESYPNIIIDKYIINIFNIFKETNGNGEIVIKDSAISGEKVLFSIIPNNNYKLKEVSVVDKEGNTYKINDNSFIMPDKDVIVKAIFEIENPNTLDNINIVLVLYITSIILLCCLIHKKGIYE